MILKLFQKCGQSPPTASESEQNLAAHMCRYGLLEEMMLSSLTADEKKVFAEKRNTLAFDPQEKSKPVLVAKYLNDIKATVVFGKDVDDEANPGMKMHVIDYDKSADAKAKQDLASVQKGGIIVLITHSI